VGGNRGNLKVKSVPDGYFQLGVGEGESNSHFMKCDSETKKTREGRKKGTVTSCSKYHRVLIEGKEKGVGVRRAAQEGRVGAADRKNNEKYRFSNK